MNSISIILKNIRNLLPYFLLIAIYFFFINLEARKEINKKRNSEREKVVNADKTIVDDRNFKIKIPVIPYYE